MPWMRMLLLIGALLAKADAVDHPLRVVSTFLPAYCFAANVAGDSAQVENLLPGNVDVHDYQLSPSDIRKLTDADLIVANGLGMEGFLDKAIANTGPETAKKIARLSDGLETELIYEGQSSRVVNPHIWLDPRLAMRSVSNLAKAFAKRDAGHAAKYAENARAYLERLSALDHALEQSLGSVREFPFVTYHNAFPYFVRRYGLRLAGVVEQVPEVAPSPREMTQLLRKMREERVKALFTEPAGSTRLAQQIARDAGVTLAELDPIETGVIEPRAYEEGMRRNAQTLLKILAP